MTDKSLKNKAIKIQNKSYVLVSDRVAYFNETYPNGMIETKIISYLEGKIVMKAKITPDVSKPERYFIGHSQADEKQGMVNKTAAIENCETSCVGRGLGLMGIGVIDSIASVDEMHKAGVVSKPTGGVSGVCEQCGGIVKAPFKICWTCKNKQNTLPDITIDTVGLSKQMEETP